MAIDTGGTPPVAIGGIGGSGTRLVAGLLRSLGFHLGCDLNGSTDTLWFTLLFKRLEIAQCGDAEFDHLTQALVSGLCGGQPLDAATTALVERLAEHDRLQHDAAWLRERAESLLAAANLPARSGHWGWKEPNTHIVIERLWQRLPGLRYIHVVRNGLDMAFSSNQNQLQLWGPRVLGTDGPITPERSLAYWCRVHRRMKALLSANLHRMHWFDYDGFCRDPHGGFERLRRFLALLSTAIPDLDQVRVPEVPRHADRDLSGFTREDLDYVSMLGYRIADHADMAACDADA